MIEPARGRLILRCDLDGCERAFRPRAAELDGGGMVARLAAGSRLRRRALLYGWRVDAPDLMHVRDLCPEHAR